MKSAARRRVARRARTVEDGGREESASLGSFATDPFDASTRELRKCAASARRIEQLLERALCERPARADRLVDLALVCAKATPLAGSSPETRRLLGVAAERVIELDPSNVRAAPLCMWLALACADVGDDDEVERLCTAARECAERVADVATRTWVSAFLALRATLRGRARVARKHLADATLHEDTAPPLVRTMIVAARGHDAFLRGDRANARRLFEVCVGLSLHAKDDLNAGVTLGLLGDLHRSDGHLDDAWVAYRRARASLRRVGAEGYAAIFAGYEGCVLLEMGEPDRAARALSSAIRVLYAHGEERFVPRFLLAEMVAHVTQGRVDRALGCRERCIALLAPVASHEPTGALATDATPIDRTLLDVHDGHFEIHRGGHVADAADAASIEVVLRIESVLASPHVGNDDVAWALRTLRRSAARLWARLPTRPRQGTLAVTSDASTVHTPDGTRIDLERRQPLRLLLLRLALARLTDEPAPLGPEALFAAAWPGERATSKSAVHRVRVAVFELRKLGLAPWIETSRGCYALERSAPLRVLRPRSAEVRGVRSSRRAI